MTDTTQEINDMWRSRSAFDGDDTSSLLDKVPVKRIDWSALLRTLGAMSVVAGMCAYLLQSWDAWGGISRFYVMLGGSAALATGGFSMSYLLRENKGARVFFGLALICSMVTLTTLGGFINAVVNPQAAQMTFVNAGSSMFGIDWFMADTMTLLGMGAAALLLLTPIAWFSFKIMNRPHAERLLACFAVSGLLLLIPVRESLAVGILILAAVAVPFAYLYRKLGNDPHFGTWEGRFSAAVLFAPAIIMVARMLWLYQADVLIGWILSAIVFAGCQLISRNWEERSAWLDLNKLLAMGAAVVLAFLSIDLLQALLPGVLHLPLGAAIFAGLCQLIALQGAVKYPTVSLIGFTAVVLLSLLNATVYAGFLGWSLCLIVGATLILLARVQDSNSRSLNWMGAVTIAVAILPWLFELGHVVDFTNWISLAVVGVSAIVAGSLLERRKRRTAD